MKRVVGPGAPPRVCAPGVPPPPCGTPWRASIRQRARDGRGGELRGVGGAAAPSSRVARGEVRVGSQAVRPGVLCQPAAGGGGAPRGGEFFWGGGRPSQRATASVRARQFVPPSARPPPPLTAGCPGSTTIYRGALRENCTCLAGCTAFYTGLLWGAPAVGAVPLATAAAAAFFSAPDQQPGKPRPPCRPRGALLATVTFFGSFVPLPRSPRSLQGCI